ncbi:hypothetical protein GBAR_LOCUS12585 [Geodia barretti]|uniref:Uncharacterized protein n=1 Tax=Geodia barretti TaxID=519541 RepID=A0AA35WNR3_GEOBA|nr:hypothetical protein GBAR_LOCUS12585 [Geodia barretti]
MCTSQGVWLVCEGAENEFICKESKSNLTDMRDISPSPSFSPTPSPAPDQTSVMGGSTAVEDCGCEPPTALLAIVAVLIVAICGLILLVVILIVALARTNRKLKPSPKESVTTNDDGTTDQDDDQTLVVPFSIPESKSNSTDMTSTIPSSPTPSPAPDQTSVMGVVALIVALARTNRKLKPSPKESSNDRELSNPVYDPLACNVTSTARVTTNDNGTTDQDDDQTLHHFSNILYHTPQVLSNNTSAVS